MATLTVSQLPSLAPLKALATVAAYHARPELVVEVAGFAQAALDAVKQRVTDVLEAQKSI